MATFRIPTHQFRSIPSPVGDSRVGLFFSPVSTFPARELSEWKQVNPREVNQRSSTYGKIVKTLQQEPARFHERNRGLTIIAKELLFDEKRKEAVIALDDSALHGLVDGGHTLAAIEQAQGEPREGEETEWPAHVFVKVLTGVDASQIAEIAGGLNTSQQVDLKSLANLQGYFAQLMTVLKGAAYEHLIAYKMNEDKPIDVREVLYYLAVFDCSEYTDVKHPVALFGRKEGIVKTFAEQASDAKFGTSFRILISKAPEILRLRDLIEKYALKEDIGRYKAGKKTRVRSETNKVNHLFFLNEDVSGRIPLGWVLPMLAGFRANVIWDEPKGTFSWIVPIDELLDSCIEQLVGGITEIHEQENSRPEYVGRNALAWRICYNAVSSAIKDWRLANR